MFSLCPLQRFICSPVLHDNATKLCRIVFHYGIVKRKRGKIHSDVGAATCSLTWRTHYYKAKKHRTNGPAVVRLATCGKVLTEEWMIRGVFERAGGPALIRYYLDGLVREQRWIKNGFLHRSREEGPARIRCVKKVITDVEYYENGWWIRLDK